MKTKILFAATLLVSLVLGFASAAPAQDRDTVVNSMKNRYPALLEAKNQGLVGEAWTGLVGLVDPNAPASIKALADNENLDRRNLFQAIARETGTSLEEVARQNRIRQYRLAEDNHFIQDQNRRWVLKKDLP